MKNNVLIPLSIVIAAIIVGGALIYKPGAASLEHADTQQAVKPLDYVDLAGTLGLDTAKFKTCVDTHAFKDEVTKDQADGDLAGVTGTPTTFINGQKIDGAAPYATYKDDIEKALADPKATVAVPGVTPDDDAVLGDPKASVTVIVFGDYQCPFCGQAYQTSEKQMRADYVDTGKVKMIFRDYPLTNIHPAAWPAAEAAECAGAQGKYWAYHDALYDNQANLPMPSSS